MSSPPHAEVPTGGVGDVATFSARERWLLLGASLWLVTGLQLDAFAHSTIPDLETFWTPWHAVLYSGIAACGLTLLLLLRPRLPQVITYRSLLRETPTALRLPVVGMGLLLVGGAIDTLWHNLFGIEEGLEILVSPSHFVIIIGMVMVAAGPALMLAAVPGRSLRGGDAVVVAVSALLAALPVHIFTVHASALETPLLGTGAEPMRTFSLDAQMVHGYVGSTVVLLIPILLIARRWHLTAGIPTMLTAVPAALMAFVPGNGDAWLPVTVAAASAVVEVAVRASRPRFRLLHPDQGWMLIGLLAPPAVWGAVLAVGQLLVGVGWNLHLVTGLVMLTGLTGLATAFVTRRVQVAPVPVAR